MEIQEQEQVKHSHINNSRGGVHVFGSCCQRGTVSATVSRMWKLAPVCVAFKWSISKKISQMESKIPPNIRDIVYCTGVSLMDEDVWEFIWMKFHSTTAVSEKKILLEALTCSDNTFLLNRYATTALSGSFHLRTKRVFKAILLNTIDLRGLALIAVYCGIMCGLYTEPSFTELCEALAFY
ncbi:hypothetical protein GOODEAATRI_018319 [Goodea atripinnis]|uniref:ERAP1-like C-terminal domain-containing protein n=1 Tax=Goodea atripinnis TaxID=208336 RepID=A0ABV0NL81_9TELE